MLDLSLYLYVDSETVKAAVLAVGDRSSMACITGNSFTPQQTDSE